MIIGQPKLLKEVNEDIIRDLIYEKGPISKPELSKLTNLSMPTVNKLVDALEEKKVIRQEGVVGSSSGRKAKVYVPNENAGNIIALYFWENNYIAELVNRIGESIVSKLVPVNTNSRQEALCSTCEIIDELWKDSKAPIHAVGVGVPGVVKKNNCITGISSIKGWEDLNLKELLEEKYEVPVFVENDVKLSTIGYYHTYLENRFDHMVYLYVGEGIGSGIIINRMLYQGFNSFAGEAGYMAGIRERDGELSYADRGGWLEYTLKEEPELLEELLAMIIVNYAAALNPEAIVVQGQRITEELLKKAAERVRKYIPVENMPEIMQNTNKECGIDGIFNMCMAGLSASKVLVVKNSV